MNYVSTRGLCVGYDGKALIRDISLDIEKGEIVVLIGPNGAGKSTILKTLTRQLKRVHGEVTVADTALSAFTHRELSTKMAVVLTDRLKPELMTCRDIVATGRYPYTGRLGLLTPEDDLKVDEAMAAVHALDLAHRDFNAISDGQRQRVLLARAICQEPEIIVLDEPTSFLDIRHKLDLLSILRGMARQKGITVVLSLHEIDLAQKLADRVLCVKGDRIFAYGAPDEIFDEAGIRSLYSIENGFYDPSFGSIELPRPAGEPRTLVLCGCGTGIPVFRRLQRQDRPFIAGILYTNDADYRLARLLAAEVITEQPFTPLTDKVLKRASEAVEAVDTVIDAQCPIGPGNARIAEIQALARAQGKLIPASAWMKQKGTV